MKLEDIITISQPRAFSLQGPNWKAQAGRTWETGKTKSLALTSLKTALDYDQRHAQTHVYRVTKDKTRLLHLYWSNGWQYDIINLDDPNDVSGVILATLLYTEALGMMDLHVAQYDS